jgi:hypothetical protein
MVPTRRGVEELQWLVLATLPLHALLSGLGSAAAQRRCQEPETSGWLSAGHQTQGGIVRAGAGAATRLQVLLEADLPAEAYQALIALDLSVFRHGPVHYDCQRGRWRSELDEWQQAKDPGPE